MGSVGHVTFEGFISYCLKLAQSYVTDETPQGGKTLNLTSLLVTTEHVCELCPYLILGWSYHTN